MSVKVLSLLVIGFTMLGCAQPKQTGQDRVLQAFEDCDEDELCSLASLLTSSSNKFAEEAKGEGVRIRNAETDGTTVTVNFDVPQSLVDAPTPQGVTSEEFFTENYRDGACDSEGIQRMFEVGGKIRVVSFLPSGEKFSDEVISSC